MCVLRGVRRHPTATGGKACTPRLLLCRYSGLATASDLLHASLRREEERRWRLQLMCDGMALRTATTTTAAPLLSAALPWHPHGVTAPYSPYYPPPAPYALPYMLAPPHPAYVAPAPQPAAPPPGSPPPTTSPLGAPPHPQPSTASPPAHTTFHVHAQPPGSPAGSAYVAVPVPVVAANTTLAAPPSPAVLVAPPGPPSAVPYDIWQLFNGRWYRLISTGEWVPSGCPPASTTAALAELEPAGTPPRPAPRGAAPGLGFTGLGLPYPAAPQGSPASPYYGGARQQRQQRVGGEGGAALARELAAAILQLLQHHLGGGRDEAAAAAVAAQRWGGAAGAAPAQRQSEGAGGGDAGVGAAGAQAAPQYFQSPEGQVFCLVEGRWFEVNQAVA